jgi:DNA repair exonuclease SbcCD ATPase subunit
MNYYNWDMRTEDATKFDGMVLWWSSLNGPKVVPGHYTAALKVGADSVTQNFKILADPRITASKQDLEAQYNFLSEIRDKVSETHEAITDLRKTRSSLNSLKERLGEAEEWEALTARIDSTVHKLTEIEETLYQTKSKSSQDPLNFPIRLNNKLAHLLSLNGMGDFKPTDQEVELKNELTAKIDAQLEMYRSIKKNSIPEINEMVIEMKVPAISAD